MLVEAQHFACVGFLLAICYVPYWAAAATVPRWAFLSLVLPVVMVFRDVEVPVAAFLLVIGLVLTVPFAPNTSEAFYVWWLYLLYVLTFYIGRSLDDLRPVFVGAALGLWVNSLVVAGQYFRIFDPLLFRGGSNYAALFGNYIPAAEAAGMVVIGLVVYRCWWPIAGVVPTLLAGARGPAVAFGVAAVCLAWTYSRRLTALAVVSAGAVLTVLVLLHPDPLAGFEERLNVWRDLVPNLTVLGHGLGSFVIDFPKYQDSTNALLVRFEYPHNDLLNLAYELGVVGVLLWAVLVFRVVRSGPCAERYALVVFLVAGMLAFPLYMPLTGFLAALCAGRLYRPGVQLRGVVGAVRAAVYPRDVDRGYRGGGPCGKAVSP